MPTGYTAPVGDGSVTEFPEFAKRCARAFGALVMMRDEPMDAPLPTKPDVSTYHRDALERAEKELAELEAMTDAEVKEACDESNLHAVEQWEERSRRREEQAMRYEAMLNKVRAWRPPTSDHEGLKDFMVEQLQESIRFDCSSSYDEHPKPVDCSTWREARRSSLNESIIRHRKEWAAEVGRAESRHKWLTDLLESLR